jgi:hypothetical protein
VTQTHRVPKRRCHATMQIAKPLYWRNLIRTIGTLEFNWHFLPSGYLFFIKLNKYHVTYSLDRLSCQDKLWQLTYRLPSWQASFTPSARSTRKRSLSMSRHLVPSISAYSFIGAAVLLLTAFGEGASNSPSPTSSSINKTSVAQANTTNSANSSATTSTELTEPTALVSTILALTMASDPAAMFNPRQLPLPPLAAANR